MAWAPVAAAGISALGGLFGRKKVKTPTPYNTSSMFGSVTWDPKSRQMTMTPSGDVQNFANIFSNNAAMFGSGNTASAPTQQFAFGPVQGMLPGLFGGALDASGTDVGSMMRYQSSLGRYGGGFDSLGDAASSYGLGILGGQAPGLDQSNAMFGLGMGLMNPSVGDYRDIAASRLQTMRDQAAPFEQRSFNDMQTNLFNTGRLGSSGGALQTEAFARGLGQADQQRILDSQGFAEQLYGRDLQNAQAQRALGSGLLGNGLQGILNSYGTQADIGRGFLGLGGTLYGQGATNAGNLFDAQQGFNTLNYNRANQRLASAQQMFGFGLGLQDSDIANQYKAIGGFMGLGDVLDQQARTGISGAGLGQQVTQPSAGSSFMGGLLSGIGNGLMQNPSALAGMFGGWQPNQGVLASGPNSVDAAFSGFNPQPYGK